MLKAPFFPAICTSFHGGNLWLLLLPVICGFIVSAPVRAAEIRGQKDLSIVLDSKHLHASITVPEKVASVAVEYRKAHSAKWITYKTIKVKSTPSTIHLILPTDLTLDSWRATGASGKLPVPKKVFPTAFYKGKSSFSKTLAPSYAVQTNVSSAPLTTLNTSLSGSSDVASSVSLNAASLINTPSPTTGTPVQADIWETLGTTAYFFNQLRGLQVIDISDPANPVLTASYRLPAVGQDLYIVQGSGSTNYAILLTQQYDQGSSQYSTGVLMIAVSGSTAQLVSSNSFPGWMADSRMVGNQLYLSTEQWAWDSNGNEDSTTLNQMTVDPVGGAVIPGSSQVSQGSSPVISAGDDWLAVSQYNNNNWQSSSVTLYGLGTNGATLLTTNPIVLSGNVSDEYDVQYTGGILSAVSQQWVQNTNNETNDWWWYNPVTTLQNFTPDGTLQGSIQIDASNSYSVASFVGTTLYVVTSGQNSPLYVIDNSKVTNPVIAGQVSLSGETTQIEPLGTHLFTLGYDSNWQLTASLYDVSSLSNPNLLSSVGLSSNANTSWGYSPATWNQEAYNVMTNAGLVTIPYSCYNSDGTRANYIQLLSLNTTNGALSLAGNVPTGANPLRSAMVGNALASITQQELVTADVSNPNSPNILADLTLAWTVDKIAVSSNFLIELTAGTSWDGEVPAATVATVTDPDNALSQTNLGAGVILDAKIQGNTLYVLRQYPANNFRWWYPILYDGLNGGQSGQVPALYLDTYDASQLPALNLLGSSSTTLPGSSTAWDVGPLLFPSTNCVAVVAQPQALDFWGFFGPGPIAIDPPIGVANRAKVLAATPAVIQKNKSIQTLQSSSTPSIASASCCIVPGYRYFAENNNTPASALIWQVNDPTTPLAQTPIELTDTNATPVKYSTASSNLLVFGYGEGENWLGGSGSGLSSCTNFVGILDLTDPTTPILGPGIALPGRLKAVSELTYNGFLAWTESWTGNTSSPGSPQVQVSSCDTVNVYQVTSLNLDQQGCIAASGNNLFTIQGSNVNGFVLDNSGNLDPSGSIPLSWNPVNLSAIPSQTDSNACTLLGSDGWNNVFSTVWSNSGPGSVLNDPTPLGTTLTNDIPMADGSLLSPVGSYGVDLFEP